jgi:predicted RNA-binding protein with PUA-like domain
MQYWLVKQEPEDYSWSDLARDGKTVWTGVRNYQARNNLRAMKKGDRVLFYHSGEDRSVVGLAQVARPAYPDPTATEGDWSCVELSPVKALKQPVSLAAIKAEPILQEIHLVRNGRLSVMPLSANHYQRLLELGGTA